MNRSIFALVLALLAACGPRRPVTAADIEHSHEATYESAAADRPAVEPKDVKIFEPNDRLPAGLERDERRGVLIAPRYPSEADPHAQLGKVIVLEKVETRDLDEAGKRRAAHGHARCDPSAWALLSTGPRLCARAGGATAARRARCRARYHHRVHGRLEKPIDIPGYKTVQAGAGAFFNYTDNPGDGASWRHLDGVWSRAGAGPVVCPVAQTRKARLRFLTRFGSKTANPPPFNPGTGKAEVVVYERKLPEPERVEKMCGMCWHAVRACDRKKLPHCEPLKACLPSVGMSLGECLGVYTKASR